MPHKPEEWWQEYSHFITPSFDEFLRLESQATELFYYSPYGVLGLLQTEEYANLIFTRPLRYSMGSKALKAKVALRMKRQWSVLERLPHIKITAILEEPVLHRSFGEPIIMRGQLESLLQAMKQPNLFIRVLPLNNPLGPVNTQSLLFMKDALGIEHYFKEDLNHMQKIESGSAEAFHYRHVKEFLVEESLSTEDSARIIENMILRINEQLRPWQSSRLS